MTSSISPPKKNKKWNLYPVYKNSGVEWLGKIPAHWDLKRLRSTVMCCQNGVWGNEPDGLNDIPCVRVTDFDRVAFRVNMTEPTMRSVDDRMVGTHTVRAGDLLLEKSGGGDKQPVGAVVMYDHNISAVCSNFIARMPVAEGFFSRFLTFFHAALYAARINTRSIKQNTGIQNLDSSNYLNEVVACPALREQIAIASFLDRETAKIDALIEKKERLIELLQEKRTALITQAVTKGLDPTVPMKDSRVEWLGKIPAHWEVLALKRVVKRIQTGTTPATSEEKYYLDGTVAWYGPGSFSQQLTLEHPAKLINELAVQVGAARLFDAGTTMIVTIGATIGKVGYLQERGSANQQITGVAPLRDKFDTRFLAYQVKQMEPVLLGIASRTTLPILDQEEVGYLPVVVPPIQEQSQIVRFIELKATLIDEFAAKSRKGIDRLKEYRVALISAAVTGKIDLRGEVSR